MARKTSVREKFSDIYKVLESQSAVRSVALGRSTSSGVLSLDAALGGPLPSGAVEIYGESSSGKSSLLYEIIATAQKSGMLAALCQSEYLDVPYMRRIGVDLTNLILLTGNGGEDVFGTALNCLNTHSTLPVVLAIDSATSFRPKDDAPGNWTRMIDSFLTSALEGLNSSSCIVMVNQVRTRRSLDPGRFFVDGEVSSTAKKIIDLFGLRLELRRGESRGEEHVVEVNVVSSAVSRPATVLQIPIVPGEGIDTIKDLLQYGVACRVVSKLGTQYSVDGTLLGRGGLKEAVAYLEKDPLFATILLDRLMVKS